jgi:SAM-dependent methyltransferase
LLALLASERLSTERSQSRLARFPLFRSLVQQPHSATDEQLGSRLIDRLAELRFDEALETLILGRGGWTEAFNYMYYRYTQPRHLEAASFLSYLEPADGPVLDRGCGMGHLTWYTSRCVAGRPIIGVDIEFGTLYFAANLVAPTASFVCTSAEARLPFADRSLGSVVSSDAFHYFMHRTTVASEVKRVIREGGLAMILGVRNRLCDHLHPPARFYPLAPRELTDLMAGLPSRLIPDRDVLARYVRKLPPDWGRSWTDNELASEPKNSLVATTRMERFRDSGAFPEWPHGEGRLGLNPLYRMSGSDGATLQRTYPSDFYERENGESRDYLPERVAVSRESLDALREGRRTPELTALMAKFVVLGLPECYFTDGQVIPPAHRA